MKSENEGTSSMGNTPHAPVSEVELDTVPRYNRKSLQIHVPSDVAEYIKAQGGSGFVVGLVRSVMR